MIRNTNQMLK